MHSASILSQPIRLSYLRPLLWLLWDGGQDTHPRLPCIYQRRQLRLEWCLLWHGLYHRFIDDLYPNGWSHKQTGEALQIEAEKRYSELTGNGFHAWITVTVFEPLRRLLKRNGTQVAITLLLFVFLFKIGEAFLGRMSITFYKEIGFSNEQIGYYSKLIAGVLPSYSPY